MAHDPLCPYKEFIPGEGFWIEEFTDPPKPKQYAVACQCDLIAKVRADQEVETLSDVADAAILFLGYTGDEVRKLTVDALDALRNSR